MREVSAALTYLSEVWGVYRFESRQKTEILGHWMKSSTIIIFAIQIHLMSAMVEYNILNSKFSTHNITCDGKAES